jgi:predicted phage terminase large subunit-like protein
MLVTTTPRPTKIIKELVKDPTTIVTHGTSYENKDNLSATFFSHIIKKYENTRLGRQELNAEILEDVEGALWSMALVDKNRVIVHPDLRRVVVAVDPSTTANNDSDETGLIVVGVGVDGHVYVLEDQTGIMSPNQWGVLACRLYHKHGADRIVAEVNQGGDMVELIIKQADPNISYQAVHASRGKVTRAEPVVALYEQGKVHHVGQIPKLEDEMTTWDSKESIVSPGRIDALVWGVASLMFTDKKDTNFWG